MGGSARCCSGGAAASSYRSSKRAGAAAYARRGGDGGDAGAARGCGTAGGDAAAPTRARSCTGDGLRAAAARRRVGPRRYSAMNAADGARRRRSSPLLLLLSSLSLSGSSPERWRDAIAVVFVLLRPQLKRLSPTRAWRRSAARACPPRRRPVRAEAWRVSDADANDETLERRRKMGFVCQARGAAACAHARASKSDCTSSSRLGVKALLRYTNCDRTRAERVR